jgi:hypothetical protein
VTGYDMPEREFQAEVIRLAKLLGWRVYHTFNSRRSASGFPDLVLVRDRVMYAELKTDRGKPTPLQLEWAQALTGAGAEVYLWRPAELQAIAETLARRTQRPEEVAA